MKDLKLNLDLKLETQPSYFGQYVKIAQKDETKVFLNVVCGTQMVPHPKNPESQLPVQILMVRMRIHGGGPTANPVPGFANATWESKNNGAYWKVKMPVPVTLLERGFGAFAKQVKDVVTPDLMAAIKAACKKAGLKMAVGDETLQTVIEERVDQLPLAGRLTVYSGVSFDATKH